MSEPLPTPAVPTSKVMTSANSSEELHDGLWEPSRFFATTAGERERHLYEQVDMLWENVDAHHNLDEVLVRLEAHIKRLEARVAKLMSTLRPK